MFKFLLFPLLMLASCAATQVPSFDQIQKSTFKVIFDTPTGERVGTAFCVPGQVSMAITAAHVIQEGFRVYNYQDEQIPVKAIMSRDTKNDIATLMFVEQPCQLSVNEWAPRNEEPSGRQMILFGYAAGKRMLTVGNIASPVGETEEVQPGGQLANLNALGGHSGGPVYNPEGKIVGMLVGSVVSRDVMDVIIPVEMLKRAIR